MNQPTADYIAQHANDDVRQLALRGSSDPAVNLPWALDQIAGRQTACRKLPSWAAVDGIVYPPHLSMEQCSSQQTARYKQQIIGSLLEVSTIADLTGGFGVDFSFLAQRTKRAVYVERQEHLCAIARHNFKLLGLQQAEVVCAEAKDYLRQMSAVDLIYIDPARRDSHGARTYAISQCTPDVLSLLPLLLTKSRYLLLKLSPMLDWHKAVSDLGSHLVSQVHIVSVQNECKELLIVMQERASLAGSNSKRAEGEEVRDGSVNCVNLQNDGSAQYFSYSLASPPIQPASIAPLTLNAPLPSRHLFEPNASIMKAGCFAELAHRYGLAPLAPNSHLFVTAGSHGSPFPSKSASGISTEARSAIAFPGRVFTIEAVTTLNKRELKTTLGGIAQANISARNFPISVADLRRRLKLSEGGNTYIFATTLAHGEKVLLICKKAFALLSPYD